MAADPTGPTLATVTWTTERAGDVAGRDRVWLPDLYDAHRHAGDQRQRGLDRLVDATKDVYRASSQDAATNSAASAEQLYHPDGHDPGAHGDDITANEGTGRSTLTFTVTLSSVPSSRVTVAYATNVDGSPADSAVSGRDLHARRDDAHV